MAARPRKVLFWRVALLVAASGLLFATVGELLFEGIFAVDSHYRGNERAALAVCGCSFGAFLAACANVYQAVKTNRTFEIAIPANLNTWLATAAAVALGLAIGTTVFR